MKTSGARVLYITYDGLTDPLGRSQVLPYLVGLSQKGHRITILSAEKDGAYRSSHLAVAEMCRNAGLDWRPERYHKTPPVVATVRDLRTLKRTAVRLHQQEKFQVVHCRNSVHASRRPTY